MPRRPRAIVRRIFPALLLGAGAAHADGVSGSIEYRGARITPAHVFLVKGPDALDPDTIVRQLIFSTSDLSDGIRACTTLSCATNDLTEGMTADFGPGPRVHYWIVRKGGLVQYSGTVKTSALSLRIDEPDRVAGTLRIDDGAAGGGTVDLEFEATLRSEFRKAR